jgi:membrane protease YdiL (CAAX protease family)
MVAIAFEIVVSRYFGPMEPTALWELMTTAQAAYAITFYAVFFAPIAEEVVFRGFFFPIFEKRWCALVAVLLCAIAFASAHVPSSSRELLVLLQLVSKMVPG